MRPPADVSQPLNGAREVSKVTHTQESVIENIRPVGASEDDDVQCGIEAWREEGVNDIGGVSETDA